MVRAFVWSYDAVAPADIGDGEIGLHWEFHVTYARESPPAQGSASLMAFTKFNASLREIASTVADSVVAGAPSGFEVVAHNVAVITLN